MFNLTDKKISYVIITPSNESNSIDNNFICNKVCNILYSKDYTVLPITEYQNGVYNKSFIGISNDNNDRLRKDSIYLIDEFGRDSVIIKYKDEDVIKKLLNNGSEKLLSITPYDGDVNSKVYLYNGLSFSFTEQKRYRMLTSKNQLRIGMVVEFINNDDKWIERKVNNVDIEYERLYKLLIKYQKLRVCID